MSAANNTDLQKCNSEDIHSSSVISSQGINSADDHVRDCKTESSAFSLSTEATISETRYQTENWNNCQFTLNDGSGVLSNHIILQSDLNYGHSDLNNIDLISTDNLDDVDTLFRRCHSTYSEQQLENTDEMSWILSLDADYSFDAALQAGFDSSYSDYGMMEDQSTFHCAQYKSLPPADKQFNDIYPFNEQKNVNV